MDKAAQAGLLAGDPVNFPSNTLTIAVSPGNPKNITSFQDLTKPDTSVVVHQRGRPGYDRGKTSSSGRCSALRHTTNPIPG
jgi:ABC-type sulfate transport system substrate-binding protein